MGKMPKAFCLDKKDWESKLRFLDKEEKSRLNCFGIALENSCRNCRRTLPETYKACLERDNLLS
jgi:hypothetical protein